MIKNTNAFKPIIGGFSLHIYMLKHLFNLQQIHIENSLFFLFWGVHDTNYYVVQILSNNMKQVLFSFIH